MLNTMRWTIQTHTLSFFYFLCVAPGSSAKCNRWKSHSGKVHTFEHHLEDRVFGWVECGAVEAAHSSRIERTAHGNRIKAASIAIKPNESCASKEWIRKSDWTYRLVALVAEKEALLAQLKVDLLFFPLFSFLVFVEPFLPLLPFAFILYFLIRLFAAWHYRSTYYV